MNLLRDNLLPKVAERVEFCRVKECSSGLFRICNPIISLRHFYSIFAWICIEICGLIIWLVVRKNTQYQALSAFYGEIRRYETGRFALDTKLHERSPYQCYRFIITQKKFFFNRTFKIRTVILCRQACTQKKDTFFEKTLFKI